MLKRVVLIVAALAIVAPSGARADHQVSSRYVAGFGISFTTDDFGIGGYHFSLDAKPKVIWFADEAGGTISARVCQDSDDNGVICEPEEPALDICVQSGEAVVLEGFQAKDIAVWVYAGGVGIGANACVGAGGTTGVITLQLVH